MATYATSGGIFNNQFTANLPKNLPVKKCKSVTTSQDYVHEFVTSLFWPTLYNKSMFSYQRTLTMWHCPHSPLHAIAAERRPCSNRSISPAHRAHSSKPAAAGWYRQTDGHRTVTQTLLRYAGSVNNFHNSCSCTILRCHCFAAMLAFLKILLSMASTVYGFGE